MPAPGLIASCEQGPMVTASLAAALVLANIDVALEVDIVKLGA
jgi:hypothetical protein